MKTFIPPKKAGSPFATGVWADNALYLSGKVGIDPATGAVAESAEDQTRFAIEGIASILKEQGLSLADIVKVTVILANKSDMPAFNKVYTEYFPENVPARTLFIASALAGSATVELDVIAVKG